MGGVVCHHMIKLEGYLNSVLRRMVWLEGFGGIRWKTRTSCVKTTCSRAGTSSSEMSKSCLRVRNSDDDLILDRYAVTQSTILQDYDLLGSPSATRCMATNQIELTDCLVCVRLPRKLTM
jgi:hypothetical protein